MAQPADCEQGRRLFASIRDDANHWSRHARSRNAVRLERTRVAMKEHQPLLAGHRDVAYSPPFAPQAPLQLQTRLSHRYRRKPCIPMHLPVYAICNDSENVECSDGIGPTDLASRTTGRIPFDATVHWWPGFETPVVRLMFALASRHHLRVVSAGNPSAGYGGRCVGALRPPV
ncbi:hypothetical protein C1930_15720 [Stenotrophomonas sp. SAU14A_NAIMI4_8]|nr:hypothetical protein C1931_15760 [Stenotrophomonas sp. YAU14A_MKIMI4_1]AWH34208.1 hypothetical protein C1930_15720 [Stenotrophomonas sp. SAU14A_NAIMI4_8]